MKIKKIKDKSPKALQDHHMPKSYDISLKAYGGGGTAKSLNPKPKKPKYQSMKAVSYTHLTLPTKRIV